MKNCPSLYKIKLEHNLIDNFDNLKCLSKYNIKKINLEGNPLVSTNENYRDELFKLVPSLEVIDGINKEGNEVDSTLYGGEEEEDDDGEYEDGEEVGDISEDDKANVMEALQEAYWEAKIANKKYTPKKYRKEQVKDSDDTE